MNKPLSLFIAAAMSLASSAFSADPPVNQPGKDAAKETGKEAAKEPAKAEQPKPDPKIAEYEKAIKDLKRVDGPFPLYQRKKDILLELPVDQLGKLWHMQATMYSGIDSQILAPGMPLGNTAVEVFRFERHDESLWLVRPHISHRWDPSGPLAPASQLAFPEAILGDCKIEEENPEKKLLLVNVTSLFSGDLFRLGEAVNIAGQGAFTVDRDKTGVEQIKGFAKNTVLRMRMHYINRASGGDNPLAALFAMLGMSGNTLEDNRSAPLRVTYNLWWREEDGYMPRLADPRVGFFTEDYYDFGKQAELDQTERYITRFDLRKKDPKAERSEPVQPIVWVIDPSVPPAYRAAVREGVLSWNRAFDKLGYIDAVQVKDADPNDPDYDHADGRYNVIRFFTSEGAGYAVALFRTDPLTGRILNAAVNVDISMATFPELEYKMNVRPAAAMRADAMKALLRSKDGAAQRFDVSSFTGEVHDHEAEEALRAKWRSLGWEMSACRHGEGSAMRAAYAWNALQAAPASSRVSKEEYVKQYLRETIAHEVGHCLGLRHNFAASTMLSTAQLGDESVLAENSTTGSVMEYAPVNTQAVLRGNGTFFAPHIGPYDVWAINYGYAERAGSKPEDEKRMLAAIARESGAFGHAYMTDEDAGAGFNPYVAVWDLSSDPLEMFAKNAEMYNRVLNYAVRNLPRAGESYAERNNMVLMSALRIVLGGVDAVPFVGGIVNNRQFKGDVNEKPNLAPVAPATQRQAMRLIMQNCLGANAIRVPDSVLMTLGLDYNTGASSWQAPVRGTLSAMQSMLVGSLLSSALTDRISENQFKLGTRKDAYTITEHYGILLGGTFSEVGTGAPVSPTRRDLQRFVLDALVLQASAPTGAVADDVRSTTQNALNRLAKRLYAAIQPSEKLDPTTRDHLESMYDLVYRWQQRPLAPGLSN